MDDDDVRGKMLDLKARAFPPEDTIRIAGEIARYAHGTVAEKAVRRLVDELPQDCLSDLVREHVFQSSGGHTDYCDGVHSPIVAIKLDELGFLNVQGGGTWELTMPGGEVLTKDSVCRIALLAVWLREMGARAEELEG